MRNAADPANFSYVVAQLGARMHYAVPRVLHAAGMLETFFTDICAVKSWPQLLRAIPSGMRPAGLSRLVGRIPVGVPRNKITPFTRFGWEYAKKRMAARSPSDSMAIHLWAAKIFCELVIERGVSAASGVYTYNGAGLELLQYSRSAGLKTVMEQTIAPREVELRFLEQEQEVFPDWEPPLVNDGISRDFIAREKSEWDQADVILCGSEFVRDSISMCGGPSERCAVVPYGVDHRIFAGDGRNQSAGPLRVLTVGAIGLRKGSPYLLSAAKELKGSAVFRMVGPVGISQRPLGELRKHVEFVGPVPRSEIFAQYRWADVFLLPSLCEGSATAVYEALAAGLPVICTPNTGSVVRDGVDGFIVPVRDPKAIANSVEKLSDPGLRAEMARRARLRAMEYSVDRYGQRLIRAVTGVIAQ